MLLFYAYKSLVYTRIKFSEYKFVSESFVIWSLHKQDDPPEITHWPLLVTLVQVALCGPLYGVVLHLYPAGQLTDMTVPNVAGDGIAYVYGPEIVDPLQSTARY